MIELTFREVDFLLESLRYAEYYYENTVAENKPYGEEGTQSRFYKEKKEEFAQVNRKLRDIRQLMKPHGPGSRTKEPKTARITV